MERGKAEFHLGLDPRDPERTQIRSGLVMATHDYRVTAVNYEFS
jgi:hypothetical protein